MSSERRKIRCLALGILRKESRILVQVVQTAPVAIYRPLGGQIEFGEIARDAVVREFKEELGCDIQVERQIGWLENIFFHNNQVGHEIVCVFHLNLSDELFETSKHPILYTDNGINVEVVWISIDDFVAGRARLVPNGLLELLRV